MNRVLDKITVIKKVVIGTLVLFVIMISVLVFTVSRNAYIEDYCMKYSQEKLGDRWYDKIGVDITKEEYIEQTGYDNFFHSDYSEASLGWFEVFKCENQHRGTLLDSLVTISQSLMGSLVSLSKATP